jgi:cation diffusion facilitator family transporter
MTNDHPENSTILLRDEASRTVRRVTIWGLVLNLLLSFVKFVFGWIGGSQALLADAVHSLSDTVTDCAVIIGSVFWNAPADPDHPYGHGRIETLVACLIGLLLGIVGFMLGYRAIVTLDAGGSSLPTWPVFAAACFSIVVKEALYRWTMREGHRVRSTALAANAWHHRSDALSSVPVAAAVLGAQIAPSWTFLDPIAAVLVSFLIMHAAWKIAWPALQQLVDRGASAKDTEAIRETALSTEGVFGIHALRTRYTGAEIHVDLHLLVAADLTVREGHSIAGRVKHRILDEIEDVIDVLIHIEPYEDERDQRE